MSYIRLWLPNLLKIIKRSNKSALFKQLQCDHIMWGQNIMCPICIHMLLHTSASLNIHHTLVPLPSQVLYVPLSHSSFMDYSLISSLPCHTPTSETITRTEFRPHDFIHVIQITWYFPNGNIFWISHTHIRDNLVLVPVNDECCVDCSKMQTERCPNGVTDAWEIPRSWVDLVKFAATSNNSSNKNSDTKTWIASFLWTSIFGRRKSCLIHGLATLSMHFGDSSKFLLHERSNFWAPVSDQSHSLWTTTATMDILGYLTLTL